MGNHPFFRVSWHIIPFLVRTIWPSVKDLHGKPSAESSPQNSFRHINDRQVTAIEGHRSQARAPSAPWPETTLVGFRIKWLLRLIRIGYLEDVYLLRRDGLTQILEASLELLLQYCFALHAFDQARLCRRIGPLSSSGLESVETKAYIWSIDFLHKSPDILPIWCMRGPAPILVRKPIIMLS